MLLFWSTLSFVSYVAAFQVPILDTGMYILRLAHYSRQICSGMWGDASTYINVTFDASSQGQLSMVIYEWADAPYLGKANEPAEDADQYLPKTYICTTSAVSGGFCTQDQLGRFILDLPAGKSINDTSFWSARVELPANKTSTRSSESDVSGSGFWNNPAGNPTPPVDEHASPWRRRGLQSLGRRLLAKRENLNPSPTGILSYTEPIQYLVRKTGYYCVAVIPVTVQSSSRRADTDVQYHPSYKGVVLFKNKFQGQLPATDYPKVNFYFVMFIVYTAFGLAWAWMCYRHLNELLPIQYYLSGLVGLLVIEMIANWGYYRYLNAHGKSATSTVFLIVVAILDAGRNSMSFFMLLVVSLGLSVVRESLDRTMRKCQLLALAHFVFGILYAIGIVELELESTSALVLLLFIIPLAFTLSGFLLWIMYALNATIAELRARKQRYKLKMFERLYHILLFAVLVIAAFFVVSSMSFSGRLAEDYAAKSWRLRWWLLDGWLALLYFGAFSLIAFLWRPSENNRRYVFIVILCSMVLIQCLLPTLAMSDEIAQDEDDAEDYDLEAIQHRTRTREDDELTLVGSRRGGENVAEDNVVFEIGDEDDDDDSANKKRGRIERLSGENHLGQDVERQGLMGNGQTRNRDE